MTRLEKAARDYAIALLASRNFVLGDVGLLDGLSCWEAVCAAMYMCAADPGAGLRLVPLRVALYLRLMRRVDALEERFARGWSATPQHWAEFRRTDPVYGPLYCCEPCDLPATPWRPLWVDAPAHDPNITPKQRRAARAAEGRQR